LSTYTQTLDYLFRQLPMFQRIGPAAMKKDLGNIRALCAYLGHPEQQIATIHIAGTNGKGSTSHILAAALQAMGWKTGLYTSPHYRDFRERIKINGELISKRDVVQFVETHRSFIEQLQPSFFEITVAMAFDHFARQQVDIAVIETGLGGRLDSTNILEPLLSVITNIGYDHQQFLGDTLPEIAGEKAGIIKRGTPVVIGQTQPEVKKVFEEKAIAMGAPIIFADQIYRTQVRSESMEGMQLDLFERDQLIVENLFTDLSGPFQALNLNTAFGSLDTLGNMHPNWKIPPEILPMAWHSVKSSTNFLGRWHTLGENPRILADSAHNVDGLRPALQKLQEIPHRKLHIVLGIVADKNPEPVLSLFPPEARYYFAKAAIPRGLAADQLQQTAQKLGLEGKTYSSVRRALAAAKRAAEKEDLIFVGGSIFTVAEVV
jgi:dihydrofolate synthase/folylpolyglutamate synthase